MSRETNVQHLFFFLTGILAGQWVIGGDVVHSLYAVRRRQHHLALDIISRRSSLLKSCKSGSCHLPHLALCRRDPHLCHRLLPLQLWILAGWLFSSVPYWVPILFNPGGLRVHGNGGLRHLLDDAPLCPLTEADWVDF